MSVEDVAYRQALRDRDSELHQQSRMRGAPSNETSNSGDVYSLGREDRCNVKAIIWKFTYGKKNAKRQIRNGRGVARLAAR